MKARGEAARGGEGPLCQTELDSALVEATIDHAERAGLLGARYLRERDGLYGLRDPEERGRAAGRLAMRWFRMLELEHPIEEALGRHGEVASRVAMLLVVRVGSARHEGAELFVAGGREGEIRRAVLHLRPESLLEPVGLAQLLEREFLVLGDMLDPGFEYEPRLPPSEAGPTYDRLMLDRYGALWGASVEGRLARATGDPGGGLRRAALSRYVRSFPMFADNPEATFARFFEGPRATHPDFVAFAQNPRRASGAGKSGHVEGERCPVCCFPTYALTPGGSLPRRVADRVQKDFPFWSVSDGLCPQCSDLYQARAEREGGRE